MSSNPLSYLGDSDGIDNSITPYVVGRSQKYKTIQAAINAAALSSNKAAIWIQPGTYIENLQLHGGIELVGAVGEVDAGNIVVQGVHQAPETGGVGFTSINFVSDTDIIQGSSSSNGMLTFNQCICSVRDGYLLNVPNWTGNLHFNNCSSAGSVQDGLINNGVGAAGVFINNSWLGAGNTHAFVSNGAVRLDLAQIVPPIQMNSGDLQINFGIFNNTMVLSGTVTSTMTMPFFFTGADPCLNATTSGAISSFKGTFFSTATNAIIGTSSISLSNNTFSSSIGLQNTLTISRSGTMDFAGIRSNGNVGFFGVAPDVQQTGGVATAGGTYGATEQTMLQKVYNALRTFGFLS